MKHSEIKRVIRGIETRDGAGVRLRRIFGPDEAAELDPFLLLDAFGSRRKEDYLPGFPMHPHRGIETVTYMFEGSVRHRDSLGNSGAIGPGDLQWMTAGSGVIHEEMPEYSPGGIRGLQLWLNLAAAGKMKPPAYRGILAAEVPVIKFEGGELRLIAGGYGGKRGPVEGLSRDPDYFDLRLDPRSSFSLPTTEGLTAFAFVYEGTLAPPEDEAATERSLGLAAEGYGEGSCLLFRGKASIELRAGQDGAGLVFAAAPPLHEPIAWRCPIVMNTEEELDLAWKELDEGSFIKG